MRQRTRVILKVACWTFLVTVAYVLSIGPVYWLGFRGFFGKGAIWWPSVFYYPLWAIKNHTWQQWLKWYVHVGM
ncbi:hypothetical protein VT03_15305 [Planctomyces sp. SH-PL14]|nr:hypothetical protein VT03_15305 [Planctomyces sp. SH-PL14]